MIIDVVQSFARDFINYKSFRTSSRKAKIKEAYKLLTGKDIKTSCHTCYIEALFEIVNSKPMATRNYELKKGVLLEAFGDASKTCTNDTITDELGDWYMAHYPEKRVFFARVRANVPLAVPAAVPAPKVTIIPPKEAESIAADLIEGIIEAPKKRSHKAKK